MVVNNIEIDFDIDNREDYVRYKTAMKMFLKKQEANNDDTELDKMEGFLIQCIKPEQIELLLQDNKVSTLTKVFTEFFIESINQYSQTANLINDSANNMMKIMPVAEKIANEKTMMQNKIGSLEDFTQHSRNLPLSDMKH